MIRPVRKNDERLTLVARRTILAIQQLKDNGIDFTDELFWASVDDEGRVKFGDWHPGDSPEYDVVQRIWNDPWLECNAKLAAVGYKIVFGASENDCLWREFEWLFESRCREIQSGLPSSLNGVDTRSKKKPPVIVPVRRARTRPIVAWSRLMKQFRPFSIWRSTHNAKPSMGLG